MTERTADHRDDALNAQITGDPRIRADGTVAIDPAGIFPQIVQQDDTVCNNCFRQTHDLTERQVTKTSHHSAGLGNATTRKPDDTSREPSSDTFPARGRTTVCRCGRFQGVADRPASIRTCLDYAGNLAETLDALGINVADSVLFGEVAELKREPGNQNAEDDRVFAPAVRTAYQAVNPDTPNDYDPEDGDTWDDVDTETAVALTDDTGRHTGE